MIVYDLSSPSPLVLLLVKGFNVNATPFEACSGDLMTRADQSDDQLKKLRYNSEMNVTTFY